MLSKIYLGVKMAKKEMICTSPPVEVECNSSGEFVWNIDLRQYKDTTNIQITFTPHHMVALLDMYYTNVTPGIIHAAAQLKGEEIAAEKLEQYRKTNRSSLVRKTIEEDTGS